MNMHEEVRKEFAKYLFNRFADIPRKEWEQITEIEQYTWILHANSLLMMPTLQKVFEKARMWKEGKDV